MEAIAAWRMAWEARAKRQQQSAVASQRLGCLRSAKLLKAREYDRVVA